jgi:hypothetical protein
LSDSVPVEKHRRKFLPTLFALASFLLKKSKRHHLSFECKGIKAVGDAYLKVFRQSNYFIATMQAGLRNKADVSRGVALAALGRFLAGNAI